MTEHVKQILAEDDGPASAAPSAAPSAGAKNLPEDLDKMLNWALLHKDQHLNCALMKTCGCSSKDPLVCATCADTQGSPLKLQNAFDNLEDEERDDEDDMVATLNVVAHKVRMGPKPHQRGIDRSKPPKPLSKRQMDWIVAQVNSGKIHLPELDQLPDADYEMVSALCDTGSAAHVADIHKQFPGATVRASDAQKRGVTYVGAGGSKWPTRAKPM